MSIFGHLAKEILPSRIFHSLRFLKKPDSYFPLESVTYNHDGMLTVHNCDFVEDEKFKRAYQFGEQLDSWSKAQIYWRLHILFWAAERAVNLDGDFVECGVNRGGFSRSVIEYINFKEITGKKFYLLDTFEGLVEKYISDEEREHGVDDYKYANCYDEVKNTFAEFENVVIVKGAVPETLSQVTTEKVGYLSIDMNCAAPEIAAAEFFWDKMVSGAAMILDDYGWAKHIVQKHAFDEFAKQRNVPILSLPTGQGLILKP
jgi:O-methyltransferase